MMKPELTRVTGSGRLTPRSQSAAGSNPAPRAPMAPRPQTSSRPPMRRPTGRPAGNGAPRRDEEVAPAPQGHKPSATLKIVPIGGLGGVGERNMTVIEYGEDIVIVDMGLAFPDETTPGIDYIIADTTWLETQKHRIRGIVVTHAHLDHIGAIPFILPKLDYPPIYTLPLTAGLIKKRLEEFNVLARARINVITPDDTLPFGEMKFRFFRVNHNIPDGVGLSIQSPAGHVVYVTDWKFDHSPVDRRPTEFAKIARYGAEGVTLLLSDSTNAIKPGYCASERELGLTINKLFREAKGRVVFATFSSLLSRIQQVLDISTELNRKVAFVGRSMLNNVDIAISLGYLRVERGTIVKVADIGRYPDNMVTVVTTGAQGEEAAGLARMASGEHKSIQIKAGDTVVVSASPIPGNERSVAAVLSNLTREGAKVIYNKVLDIHTSGHAQQEELKMMMSLVQPKYFMPIHGEHFMLIAHGELAQQVGIPEENIFIMDNGAGLEIENGVVKRLNTQIAAGDVYVDGLGVGDVGDVVLRDRQVMAKDGMFVIICTVDKRNGQVIGMPEILSRGFTYMKDNEDFIREVRHEITKVLQSHSRQANMQPNYAFLKQGLRDDIGEFLFNKTQRKPMILPVIMEI